jgi:cystathionine beta-lyase/cystathionine gamma-synthase
MSTGLAGIDPRDVEICLREDQPAPADAPAPTSAPIVQTSLFTFPTFEALVDGLDAEHATTVYSRGRNPTVQAYERKLADLERAEACLCFSSGMAAIAATMFGTLRAGDHVLFVNEVYGPTLQLARELARFGVTHDVALDLEPDAVRTALRPATRLVWLESPGTMLFRVADVGAVASIAHEGGALCCIDNSWSTPLLQKPIELGVDLVVHTCTKYLAGHSDVVAGALLGRAHRLEEIFYRAYLLLGGALAPASAWLLLRSLRTLPVRLERQGADALRVARFLADHPAVAAVHHPALGADPALVAAQMRGFSSVLSCQLRSGGFDAVSAFLARLRTFRLGISWGGVESLAYSPVREGGNRDGAALPPGLVRLSVGLEGADALIADLDGALAGTRGS